MNRYFYGKKLNKRQKWILIGTFSPLLFIIPYLFIETGSLWDMLPIFGTWPACGILLLLMDQGPAFWYWWASFGFGHEVEPNTPLTILERDEVQAWMKTHTKGPSVVLPDGKYVFLRKNDAFKFRLRW